MSHNQLTICIPKIKTFYRLVADFTYEQDSIYMWGLPPKATLKNYPSLVQLIDLYYRPYDYHNQAQNKLWQDKYTDWEQNNRGPYKLVIPKGKIFKIKKLHYSPYRNILDISFAKKNNGADFSLIKDFDVEQFNGIQVEEV